MGSAHKCFVFPLLREPDRANLHPPSAFCVSYSSHPQENEILILTPFAKQAQALCHACGDDALPGERAQLSV